MSELKRYDITTDGFDNFRIDEDKHGRFVRLEDYAALLQKLGALRMLVESEIADFCAGLQSPGEPDTPEEMQADLLGRVATVFEEVK